MRTTLTIEDDALALARALSRRKHVSLGRAVSELVRRGALQPVSTVERRWAFARAWLFREMEKTRHGAP